MYALDRRDSNYIHGDTVGRSGYRSSRCYYLAFEGDNESAYFKIIKDNKKKLGIGDNVDCIRLYRFEKEKNMTDPKWIKARVEDYKQYLCGRIRPRLFFEFMMMEFRKRVQDNIITTDKREYEKKCINLDSDIHDMEEDVLEELNGEEYSTDGYISDSSEAFSLVRHALKEKFPEYKTITNLLNNPNKMQFTEDEITNDRFCVIVDRDYYSDKYRLGEGESINDYYDNLLDFFENSDISLYVTNPCFEFWLIEHFEDISFDEDRMLINPKESNGKRYSENTLAKRLPNYNKHSLDADEFIGNKKDCKPILGAIRRIDENGYAVSLEQSKDHLGSNIGVLIDEMRKG